jgi:hypothetical protein
MYAAGGLLGLLGGAILVPALRRDRADGVEASALVEAEPVVETMLEPIA